uniref:Uncharacterized protein n=1 Tax=Anguilla anguilla TaxID=7936 RepID=A0A0E9V1W6_ANGAN
MDTKPAACSPLCGGERHCQQRTRLLSSYVFTQRGGKTD